MTSTLARRASRDRAALRHLRAGAARAPSVFEQLRQSVRDAMNRASSPAEGRAVLAMMRAAVVEAKVAVSQVRAALDATRAQLEHERAELATVQRRGRMAAEIHDDETVRVAAQFERRHSERVAMLERKAAAQHDELSLAEREMEEMTAQLHAMAGGAVPPAADGGADAVGEGTADAPTGARDADAQTNALRREVDRAAREAEAQRRLEQLKRRMGR